MNKALNILIVAAWYKSDDNPTYGSFIEKQARMFQRNGHKVTVLHPYLTGNFKNTLFSPKQSIRIYNDNGITTLSVGIKPILPKARTLNYNKLGKLSYQTICNQNNFLNFDIIHCHSVFLGGIIGEFLSKKMNVPYVITEHTSGLIFNPNQYTKSDKMAIQRVYLNAKMVFFVSNYAYIHITKLYALKKSEKYHILGNIIDDCFFSFKKATGNFSYILIGSLIPMKNHSFFLKAWKVLLEKFPFSTITIAGDGPLKKTLINEANSLNINHSIIWKPNLSRVEVKNEIDKHHVLVSASKVETFGMTVAESIASGKPVVVTNSGGINDFVNETNGIITSLKVEDFSHGLISIQKNYKRYNENEMAKNCRFEFQEDIIYGKLIGHYKNIFN